MAEFSVGFRIMGDASQFQREMRSAVESSKQVQRGLRDIGLNIGRFVGVTAIGSWFVGTARAAQELRDEIVKIGGTVDSATASVAKFGDGLDEIKKTATGMSISVLGFFTKMGDVLAYLPLRLTGVSKAQEELAAKSAKAADEQEKQLKKSREANSPEKIAAAEKQLAEERRKNLMQTLALEDKRNLLLSERKAREEELNGLAVNTVAYRQKLLEIEKLNGDLAKTTADIEKDKNAKAEAAARTKEQAAKAAQDAADAAARQAEIEAQTTAELNRQVELEREKKRVQDEDVAANRSRGVKAGLSTPEQDMLEAWIRGGRVGENPLSRFGTGQVRTSEQLGEASPEELTALLRKNQRTISAVAGTTNYSEQTLAARLQIEIQNIKQELAFRSNLQRNVALGGIEYARQQFTGDPLAFDKFLQQYVIDNRSAQELQAKTLTLLERMDQRAKSPQPVVVMNTNQYGIR